ncbi:MAG TPA: hypothetical protein VHB27_08410 [Rhodopila sp.]|uniref:hypothetical protein n=1 Tax=Rhodopila sp. TaxID=2480087 RepID=UPI002D1A81E7|nr:hypothetical protein [Rhodopila sp.]HVY15235.1 hypothetical protein [Rhodopila sp.]
MRIISIAIAIAALLAPAAHVLEMANKLRMEGALWLQVQQQLYRGWGPFIGAPTEIAGVAVNAFLCLNRSHDMAARRMWGVAACLYVAMIAVFFVFNSPVNAALSTWASATLPRNWGEFRWQWETGAAISAYADWSKRRRGSRGTTSSGTYASMSWTKSSRN